jgi:hypothetical protein
MENDEIIRTAVSEFSHGIECTFGKYLKYQKYQKLGRGAVHRDWNLRQPSKQEVNCYPLLVEYSADVVTSKNRCRDE